MVSPWRLLVIVAVAAVAVVVAVVWRGTAVDEPGSQVPVARTTLVIGSVSVDAEDDIEEYQPIADYLVKRLAGFGYTAGEVVVAPTTTAMAELIRQGRIDLYVDSPFPTFAVDQLTRSVPLVNRWKSGVEKYRAVIYTLEDSGVASVGDLAGRVVAFDHANSTSGYFLPKAVLLEAGYTLREVAGPAAAVPPTEIGYYFAGKDGDLMDAVADGVAIAGAQNETELQEYVAEHGGRYRFLLTTPEVYRHVVTAAEHLDPTVREAVRDTLVKLHTHDEGRALLKAFKKTARFSPFEPTPSAAYTGIEELLGLVESEIISR